MPDPVGSGPGGHRPVVVVQGDFFNTSRIETVVVVPLTGNLGRAAAPGNVVLTAARTGLPRDSVANVSLITSVDKSLVLERTGILSTHEIRRVLSGIAVVLGRDELG